MPIYQKILFVEYNTPDDDYETKIFERDTDRNAIMETLENAGCFNIRFSERPVIYLWN